MAVGTRIILRPEGNAGMPLGVAPAVAVERTWREHEPGEDELGFLLPVRSELKVVIFHAVILAKRALEGIDYADANDAARDACRQPAQCPPDVHPLQSISPRVERGFA